MFAKINRQSTAPSTCAERETDFFNHLAEHHGEFNPFTEHGWQTLASRFEEMITPSKPLAILDIGCGTGNSKQLYERHADRYVGVDLANRAIDIARRRFPTDEWHVADACALPFRDGTFDVVAFSSVLHHIPDFTRALVEGRRVLKPGGSIFAFDPNALHPAMALFRLPGSPFYLSGGVSPDERPLRATALRSAVVAAGLQSVRQRCQSDIPYRRVGPRLLNAFLGMYNIADWLMERSRLSRWFGTFIVTCAQKPTARSVALTGRAAAPATVAGRLPSSPNALTASMVTQNV